MTDRQWEEIYDITPLYTAPPSQPGAVSVPREFIAAAEAILATPPNPANIVSKHKDETGYSVYEAWARRCAKALLSAAAPRQPEAQPANTVVPDAPSQSFQMQSGKHVVPFEDWLALQNIAKWLEQRAQSKENDNG